MSDILYTEESVTTTIQYRIQVSKRGRTWEYLPFTGASDTDEARITARLERVRRDDPHKWAFRLVRYTVTTATSAPEVLPA